MDRLTLFLFTPLRARNLKTKRNNVIQKLFILCIKINKARSWLVLTLIDLINC
jgi:hypothetical protein